MGWFILISLLFLDLPKGEAGTLRVWGRVVDARTKEPVPFALIQIGERRQTADPEGRFHFKGLIPGLYSLTVRQMGYRSRTLRLSLRQDTFLVFPLVPRLFEIGPVEVRARAPGPGEHPLDEQVWTASDLLHFQANNLTDVLEYLPWAELPGTRRTGPEEPRRIYLGSMPDGGDPLILRDGQVESGRTAMGFSPENFHLRDLPLEEVEEVRILRGVLPAAYGYTASGVIEVRTKREGSGEVRIKRSGFPAGAWTLFLGRGWRWGTLRVRFHMDFLQTQGERVERVEGHYRRLTPSLQWSLSLPRNWLWEGSFRHQQVFYGTPRPESFHDRSKALQVQSRLILGSLSLELNGSLKSKDFYRRRDLGYDEEGRWRGWGELQVLGEEWWGSVRLRWRPRLRLGSFLHHLDLGGALRREGNSGEGLVKATWYEDPRPSVPFGFSRWGGELFLEDQVHGIWGVPFRLRGGLRLERWTEGGGALSPRIKLQLFPNSRLTLTLGFGHNFGPPTLKQIHALPRKSWQIGLTDNLSLTGQSRWISEIEGALFFPLGSLRISLSQEQVKNGITSRTVPLDPLHAPDSVVVIYANDLVYTTHSLGLRLLTRTIGHLDLTLSGYLYETRYHRVHPSWDPEKGWVWSPRDARRRNGQMIAHLRYFDPFLNLWISVLLKGQIGFRVSWEGKGYVRPFRGYGDLKITKALGKHVLLALAIDNFLDTRWFTYNKRQGWVEEFHPSQVTFSLEWRIP